MIRIEASPRPRVRVIGSLDGRAVRALFAAISHGSVVLDLSEVNEAKESAVMFLARLPRERCRLAACPRLLSWWLKRLRRTGRNGKAVKKLLLALLGLVVLPVAALAEKPVIRTEAVVLTARIGAIDHDARLVTLVDPNGGTETIHLGPDVDRFDELKVGDTVTLRYYESLVHTVRKLGEPSALPATTGRPVLSRGQGKKPSATVTRQQTATVTIEAIDRNVPSLTVLTDEGRRLSFKVPDKKDIAGLRVADRVEITYTRALLISVE